MSPGETASRHAYVPCAIEGTLRSPLRPLGPEDGSSSTGTLLSEPCVEKRRQGRAG